MFSRRARHFEGSINTLYRARDEMRERGETFNDLISGNVHLGGIGYPQPILESALRVGGQQANIYQPDPKGQCVAREAISREYAEAGIAIPEEQIVLTPGSSVAYSYAFSIFADVGDEVLAPIPTYPLFEGIAILLGVRMVPYPLDTTRGWAIDLDRLKTSITPRTRAISLISPHNPTGAIADIDTMAGLAQIATQHQLPIIADEVFGSFLFDRESLPRPAATDAPLVLTLNGLSKRLALPGLKIGWIAVSGDAAKVRRTLSALEAISDTFLPVNEAAQFSLPILLREGREFEMEHQRAIRERRDMAVEILSQNRRISFVPPQGGFYLTFRVDAPAVDEEKVALDLLKREQILLHPGFFYDLPPSHFVVSFTSEPTRLQDGFTRLSRYFSEGDFSSASLPTGDRGDKRKEGITLRS